MKTRLLTLLVSSLGIFYGYSQEECSDPKNMDPIINSKRTKNEVKLLREKHESFLKNSPFKKYLLMSKLERKDLGIPPNKYFEMEWELTMNPETGKPDFEKLKELQKTLNEERQEFLLSGRSPGDGPDNVWIERGPTNVGGRTRAVMFDPNDAQSKIVFAGGVSGGLWKNNDITNSNSQWSRVNIPENLAVSCLTYDPNNTSVFYAGTGESYVAGKANGDGLWKSTDGGTTWAKVFGGVIGESFFQTNSSITVNSPGAVAGNYSGIATIAYGPTINNPITANIVLVNDNTGTPTLGCNALTNGAAVNGKIALIRRGGCNFTVKIKNAQDAGAIAVIVMNNANGYPIAMGGTDPANEITIPSLMISKNDGDLLENAINGGQIVNATINTTTNNAIGVIVPGVQHINDVKIRNNAGNSEIYVAAGDGYYGAIAAAFLGSNEYGLYKSTDGGATWNEVNMPLTTGGHKYVPNDIEIGADNKIWVSSTSSFTYRDGGGAIFSSTDGSNFNLNYTVADAARTQIAVSSTLANKVYVLAEIPNSVSFKLTTNGFSTVSDLALPNDADNGIPANDFTRGQAFYDLLLEVSPDNDQIVYTGGIDLFRSTNGGSSWTQISKWSNNNNLFGLSCSLVHADQHAMAFRPGNSNQAIFGNDGGVFYATSLSTASNNNVIGSRNLGYNVTQFYSLGVAPTFAVSGLNGDYFVAGAQDNGTQYFAGVPAGLNPSVSAQGGDGAFSFFDQDNDKYYITNYVYNGSINYRTTGGNVRNINSESASNGQFICPMALDSNLDILYADYTSTDASGSSTYQIRRYTNLKSGIVGKTILTDAQLNSNPTALTVSKYTLGSTKLFVGLRNGKLLRVSNANGTPVWTDISGPEFIGSISDIEFGQTENEIFVTFHNYNTINIWYSTDGGVTWQNKEGNFPDIPVKSILQNPLNTEEVIIGTDLGVWFTNNFSNASPSWHQSYNGMSNVPVTDLDLRNDNAVFAATYGRGVFSGMFTAEVLNTPNQIANNEIVVYPTVSNGNVQIASEKNYGKTILELFDISGRKVFDQSIEIDTNTQNIHFGNLPTGNYLLKMKGESFDIVKKLIIK